MPITRFLRRPEVESRTGLSRSSIYALMDRGEFPRPRRIGKRAVAWDEADIEHWLSQRIEADPRDSIQFRSAAHRRIQSILPRRREYAEHGGTIPNTLEGW